MNQMLSDVIYWVVTVAGKHRALVKQCLSESRAEFVSGDESCIRFFNSLGNPIATESNVTFAVLRASDTNNREERGEGSKMATLTIYWVIVPPQTQYIGVLPDQSWMWHHPTANDCHRIGKHQVVTAFRIYHELE